MADNGKKIVGHDAIKAANEENLRNSKEVKPVVREAPQPRVHSVWRPEFLQSRPAR
jgi:hypothetical protein